MSADDTYEVYAIRYGHHPRPASANFLGGDTHDVNMPLDYFVWAIVGSSGTIIVDTGFDETVGTRRGRQTVKPVRQGLQALVTAAAGAGIGRATARRLAAGGARVVVTDIHERRTREVTEQLSADFPETTVVGYAMDAGDRAQIDAVVDEVTRTLGPVQILVNNAAINVIGSIFDYDPADWDWCVRVNLSGAWYLCRATMPHMRDAGGGVIVNVSTYAPDVGGAGIEAPYAVTKGGLNVLTRSCAHEGGAFNIRAVSVAMGLVAGTKFVDDHPEMLERPDSRGPLGSFPDASEIAETIAFLASDRARHITGEILNVSAGSYMRT